MRQYSSCGEYISIHVSARETTGDLITLQNTTDISIHVSARETTDLPEAYAQLVLDISIHVSARETTKFYVFDVLCDFISIHVSARETTT